MQIVVLANELQKKELAGDGPVAEVIWVKDQKEFLTYPDAAAFVDLEFVNEESRVSLLSQLLPKLIIVNAVTDTLQEIHPAFVRINGWPAFLSSSLIEAASVDESNKPKAEEIFSLFNKKIEWLADDPGFVTARIVSMIINEAFLALQEGVSTKEEINTAMKLGTAYPFGPFEWAEKIGLQNVVNLLQTLSKTEPRYTPSELLVQETNKSI
jgi:3-hydroxybutyryl-CoA dehydrogenase